MTAKSTEELTVLLARAGQRYHRAWLSLRRAVRAMERASRDAGRLEKRIAAAVEAKDRQREAARAARAAARAADEERAHTEAEVREGHLDELLGRIIPPPAE